MNDLTRRRLPSRPQSQGQPRPPSPQSQGQEIDGTNGTRPRDVLGLPPPRARAGPATGGCLSACPTRKADRRLDTEPAFCLRLDPPLSGNEELRAMGAACRSALWPALRLGMPVWKTDVKRCKIS